MFVILYILISTAIYLMDPQFAALLVYETEFDDIKSLISFINFQ